MHISFSRHFRFPACLLAALACGIRPGSAPAAEPAATATLNVLLVTTGNADSATPPAAAPLLAKVLPVLRESLRFTRYQLLETHRMPLRENSVLALGKGSFKLRITDVQGTAFRIVVQKGKQTLIKMRLRLRSGKPVILGGLPGNDAEKLLIVLVLPKRP